MAMQVNAPLGTSASDVDAFIFAPSSDRIAYRADQNVDTQVELFVVSLATGAPGPAMMVNTVLPTSADVSAASEAFTRDGRALVFEADMVVNDETEAWWVDVSGAAPGTPVRLNPVLPVNGDVSVVILGP